MNKRQVLSISLKLADKSCIDIRICRLYTKLHGYYMYIQSNTHKIIIITDMVI